ncbi:MerR family transcriptional regulator [Bengtsoniella intestinalis]|uniref:MerR family transcriptional regulator n=1 Tax=Bengtsoniella intestinalis TaxID=3073143 RepID=UPI00391F18FE
MQIKEVELQSGMTRANIRFYESQGLLNPQRGDNGYRMYSQNDIETLQRIKLLRTLRVSLEDIKAIHMGDLVLETVLQTHMERLSIERQALAQAQRVCQKLQDDHVCYQTLDAGYYLNLLENPTQENPLEGDTLPHIFAPWRRLFARGLDMSVYGWVITMVAILVFGLNLANTGTGWSILKTVLSVGAMFAIEPLLLKYWGTTLGKWVLGLSVTHEEGGRLTWQQGWNRLIGVSTYGQGWYIPLVDWWRNYASYRTYERGESLPWEEDSCLVVKPWDARRVLGYLAITGAMFGMTFLAASTVGVSGGDGNMTVAEFAENYNEMCAYYDASGYTMDEFGVLQKDPVPSNGVVIDWGVSDVVPVFTFEEEDGYLTKVGFEAVVDHDMIVRGYVDARILAMLAFVGPQKGGTFLNGDINDAMERLAENPFDRVDEFTLRGVTIRSEVDYEGYNLMDNNQLWADVDAEQQWCNMAFTMVK